MLVIRLSRSGAVKRPFYHVVATDSRKKRDGRYVERLGYYNPKATEKEASLQLDAERVKYWESHGAQLSPAVRKLVKRNEKQQAGKAEKVKPQTAAQAKSAKKKQPAQAKANAPKKEVKAAAGQKPEKKESAKAS